MNKKAFSLIELIVGIMISMILMVSVGIFIGNGMQSIFSGQKVLENTDNLTYFIGNIDTTFNLINTGSFTPTDTSSGIIIKRGQNFGDGGFSYIGIETLSGSYCNYDSENPETNHIFIKNFIPFEEQGEDIFDNLRGGFTGSLTSTGITIGASTYSSYQKEHVIKDNLNNIVVGKGIFGDGIEIGSNGTNTYLNSPTGLASDGTNLYISDTLNNRILYLDGSNNIGLLLDESYGLNEPTGLHYEASENALYIANSGNGEILKYSSRSQSSTQSLNISNITQNPVTKFSLELFNNSSNENITGITKSDIITPGTSYNYLDNSGSNFEYHFINFSGPNIYQADCNIIGEKLNSSGIPINCTDTNGSTGTGVTATYINTNFSISSIILNNINNLSTNGNYYVNLKLFNGVNEVYGDYHTFFTQSDNNLTTKIDNTLEIVRSGLNYPTGIWGTGLGDYKEFIDGSYSDLIYSKKDILLNVPIESLNISNIPNNMITLVLKYYKKYNCYNPDDKTDRTYILKKNIK